MWLPGLPSAGGNAPLWQAEHCAVTTTWVWFHRVDFQLKVLWQAAQLVEPTGMWVAGLPVAWLPLWQLAQEVLWSKPLWSKPVAGVLDEALADEQTFQGLLFTTSDFQEGRAAFLEKRKPKFGG